MPQGGVGGSGHDGASRRGVGLGARRCLEAGWGRGPQVTLVPRGEGRVPRGVGVGSSGHDGGLRPGWGGVASGHDGRLEVGFGGWETSKARRCLEAGVGLGAPLCASRLGGRCTFVCLEAGVGGPWGTFVCLEVGGWGVSVHIRVPRGGGPRGTFMCLDVGGGGLGARRCLEARVGWGASVHEGALLIMFAVSGNIQKMILRTCNKMLLSSSFKC
uniref:Uncharacterized protein n=1 Tax=Solanum lycopersicum TaxID=4081 RepID=A0A3Q7GZR8_SOLLC